MSTAVSAVVYLNNRLNASIAELSANFSSIAIVNSSGQYIPDLTTKYVSSATTVKESIGIIDAALYSVGTTYAPLAYVIEQISSVVAASPSSLDTLQEIAAAIGGDANFATTIVSTIAAEAVLARSSESTILTNLNTEISRSLAAESTLTSQIASEEQRASSAEADISTNISGENVRATSEETVLLSSIQLEITDRILAFNNLTSYISSSIQTLNTDFSANLTEEINRATVAEEGISTSIVTEYTRATGAESTLTSFLNTEIARATTAEQTLSTLIADETTRASNSETAISNRTTTVENTYIKHDGTVKFISTMNAGSNRILNVAAPSSDADATNKDYVDTKVALLGSVFEYVSTVNVAQTTYMGSVAKQEVGDVYKVVGNGYMSTSLVTTKYVKDGDFLVRNSTADDWDIINNKDISILGTTNRITVSGNAFDEYILNISPNYAGQNTITTMSTVTTGTWQATVVDTAYGGLGFSNYTRGDLLVGTSGGSLAKLPVGSNGTVLRSDGTSLSWMPAATSYITMTDATNFSTSTQVQQAIDYLYDRMQKRNIIQFVTGDSTDYADSANYNSNLLSGKANFINYTGTGTVYLPPTSASISNNTVVRLIHNSDASITGSNLFVKRRNTTTSADEDVVECAPHDCMVLVYNSSSNAWMVGLGV